MLETPRSWSWKRGTADPDDLRLQCVHIQDLIDKQGNPASKCVKPGHGRSGGEKLLSLWNEDYRTVLEYV